MQKVFEIASVASSYIANAAVLNCFDHRFANAISEFLRNQGIHRPDMITLAGGGKALASPGSEADRDFVLEQVRLSIRLHQSKRNILVITHSDCGAYGGLARFGGDRVAEREFHQSELKKAMEIAAAHLPGVSVNAYFLDFEAVWSL